MDKNEKEFIKYYESILMPQNKEIDVVERNSLYLKAISGDAVAKNKFIESNLDLVASVVRSYMRDERLQYSYEDLFQEGSVALVEAFKIYEPDKTASFRTFAIRQIFWKIENKVKRENNNIYCDNTYDMDILSPIVNEDSTVEKIENKERLELANKLIKNALLREYNTHSKEELKKIFDFCRMYSLSTNYKTEISNEMLTKLYTTRNDFNKILGCNASFYSDSELFELYKYIYRFLMKIDIVVKRVMLSEKQKWTLQKLGDYYGITDQAISNHLKSALLQMKNYVIDNSEEFEEYYDVSKIKTI